MVKPIEKYFSVEKAYLEKFGENSLDRVILFDPMHHNSKDILETTQKLKQCIAKNKPLTQLTEEEWESIIF